MNLTVLRTADRVAVPWKNGGGVTRDVAVRPAGAGLDDFHWRISMAEVRQDGPFSTFPGVDRTLAVLEGQLLLDVEGRPETLVTAEGAPVSFPGDAATVARLTGGPVTDLNLMWRRSWGHARLERVNVLLPHAIGPLAPTVVVVATGGPLRVILPTAACDLEHNDAALVRAAGETLLLEAVRTTDAYVVALEPAS